MRVAKGGEVLAPGNPDALVQFIDAKDLTEWIVTMLENNESGTYNAVNKPFEITFKSLLETIKSVSGSDASFTWVSDEFLSENDVAPWSDMPLHIPESPEQPDDLRTANIDKALEKGLKIRPISETITDILNWRSKLAHEMKAGISIERERALLQKWHEQNTK